MAPRSIIKSAEWMLTEDMGDHVPVGIFRAQCTTCGKESDTVENESLPVEMWTLKHTGLNSDHRQFKFSADWFWRVVPAPGNPYRELEKGGGATS